MAFIAFLLLAAFVIIAYLIGNRDLLSPWFLLCLAFFASFCIVLINYNNWEVQINLLFIIYLVTAEIAFGAGGLLVRALGGAGSVKASKVPLAQYNIRKRYPVNTFLIISVALAALFLWKLMSDAGGGSLGERIRKIYDNIVNNGYSPGFIFNQMREIITAIAYLNTYRLLIRFYSCKDRVSIIKLIVPIVVFLAVVMIWSDRNIFLRYAIYAICLYVLFFRENYKNKNANTKIVQKVIILLLFVVVLFFLLGKIKQYSSNIIRALGIYGGSGLYNFNLWINDFNNTLTHGTTTFAEFLNTLETLLKPLGIDLNVTTADRFDSYITYQSANGYVYSSNIYSALKPYVEDFGYFGVIFFPFIIGAFYQWLFMRMKKSKYGYHWIMYCMLIYPVIFNPVAEQLIKRFTLGFIYEWGWLTVLYWFVFGRKVKVVRNENSYGAKEVNNERR